MYRYHIYVKRPSFQTQSCGRNVAVWNDCTFPPTHSNKCRSSTCDLTNNTSVCSPVSLSNWALVPRSVSMFVENASIIGSSARSCNLLLIAKNLTVAAIDGTGMRMNRSGDLRGMRRLLVYARQGNPNGSRYVVSEQS